MILALNEAVEFLACCGYGKVLVKLTNIFFLALDDFLDEHKKLYFVVVFDFVPFFQLTRNPLLRLLYKLLHIILLQITLQPTKLTQQLLAMQIVLRMLKIILSKHFLNNSTIIIQYPEIQVEVLEIDKLLTRLLFLLIYSNMPGMESRVQVLQDTPKIGLIFNIDFSGYLDFTNVEDNLMALEQISISGLVLCQFGVDYLEGEVFCFFHLGEEWFDLFLEVLLAVGEFADIEFLVEEVDFPEDVYEGVHNVCQSWFLLFILIQSNIQHIKISNILLTFLNSQLLRNPPPIKQDKIINSWILNPVMIVVIQFFFKVIEYRLVLFELVLELLVCLLHSQETLQDIVESYELASDEKVLCHAFQLGDHVVHGVAVLFYPSDLVDGEALVDELDQVFALVGDFLGNFEDFVFEADILQFLKIHLFLTYLSYHPRNMVIIPPNLIHMVHNMGRKLIQIHIVLNILKIKNHSNTTKKLHIPELTSETMVKCF